MFDALRNLGNFGDLMRRAKDLQAQMQRVQEELSRREISADAGGGMVAATVNGRGELVSIRMDKARIDPTDTEMLEDLVVAAVRAAQAKAADAMKQEMQKTAADLGIPPGMLP